MSLDTCRTQLVATIAAVAGIGIVTDYEVLTTRKEDFETFFKAPSLGYMQGWTVTRESSLETTRNQARANDRRHLFIVRGYRAIGNKGLTEKAFQDLVEAVCDAVRVKENDQLNGQADFVGPPTVRIFEPRDYAGYLVHYVEIACPVVEPKTF